MARGSGIERTESTWNPVTGCTKISPGCKYCYAERMARRLLAMGQPNYANGCALTLQAHMLELRLAWKKPQTIFLQRDRPVYKPQKRSRAVPTSGHVRKSHHRSADLGLGCTAMNSGG